MAKVQKGSVPNKSLHSRVSYLYQAASYLAAQQQEQHSTTVTPSTAENAHTSNQESGMTPEMSYQPLSRRLVSDLRSVSLKVQIRMSPAMKLSICKNCDTLLVDGSTCTTQVENKSKGGKKPWADVLVKKCNTCEKEKRFPLGAERQKRRPQRSSESQAQIQGNQVG